MSLIYRAAASMYAFASFFSRTDSQFSATLSLFFIVPHILLHFLLDDVCIYFASQPIARSWLMTTRSKKYTSQSTDISVIIMYHAPIMQSINRSINQSINQSINTIHSIQTSMFTDDKDILTFYSLFVVLLDKTRIERNICTSLI